jgi:hypothetical protein
MAQIIVEQSHDPPASPEAIAADRARLATCLAVREIEVVRVYVADNGRRVIHVLAARDAERARNAFHSAGVAFERAWTVREAGP